MRKKYLSALLFGALLFASAGTFTSCKDYDDDIKNLQEQINTVVADLNDLKTLVGDGGVSSVTFDEATGVLTVVDAAGTHTYTVKTPAGEVGEIKVTIDDERNLVVNDEIIGQVGDVVTVNEEGYLCVNGEATEIKAGKYAILENESDNTYTITLPDAEGNMQTITLLKSVATNISIKVTTNTTDGTSPNEKKYATFSEINAIKQDGYGIAWGVASSAIDWDGPKGAVQAGQLLIGQQNFTTVNVYPQNVELDKQTLRLVDKSGNYAPVTVTAHADNEGSTTTGSRTVAKGGLWNLEVTMDNTITADNIGNAFAAVTDDSGDWDVYSNKTYALEVNGNVLTDYTFVIDTDEAACEMTGSDALQYNSSAIKVDGKANLSGLSLNSDHELTWEQASVYDYKFEIVNADENDAEAWGITLENNVLKGTNAAAGKTIHLNVILLGVDGTPKDLELTNKTTNKIAVTFGQIKSDVITLPVSTYKVTPEEYYNSKTTGKFATLVLDMGDLFSGLTAQEAITIQDSKNGEVSLKTTDDTFAFLRASIVSKYNKVGEDQTIRFYAADNKTPIDFDDEEANIRNIKYAHVIYNMTDPSQLWNKKATLGEHILTMTLTDDQGNQIRKANIPVNVAIPTFFELFPKSAAWTDDTALTVVNKDGTIDLKQLYNDETDVANAYFATNSTFIADNKDAGDVVNNVVTLTTDAVNSNHTLKDVATELIYKIVPECDNFTVTSGQFTMDLVTKLDAAKFVYYGADGKESDIIVRPESENVIAAYKETDGVKSGLSFYKAGKDHTFEGASVVNGFKLDNCNSTAYVETSFDNNAGEKAKAEFKNGVLTISGLAKGNYTTVLTVIYKKASTVASTAEVWETYTISLNVQAVE